MGQGPLIGLDLFCRFLRGCFHCFLHTYEDHSTRQEIALLRQVQNSFQSKKQVLEWLVTEKEAVEVSIAVAIGERKAVFENTIFVDCA